jgi:hypothetical protein
MHIRHSGNGGIGSDLGRTCQSRPELPVVTLSSSSEQLDYIAAMVRELKIMSAQAEHRTARRNPGAGLPRGPAAAARGGMRGVGWGSDPFR